ncbi:CDP-glycerol glycerophosphotransferase family protein [Sporolactobacillus spathodeae]|uniref:CDP-glycerol glycerophosphotransferase n=1 Tax=Sporolactobacillus spathodeae TaxID=1465502 RepID=A0ABS2Q4L8_9BACL|nr:CDP-glycerol glycerophosphotransferase family protein [Sporolactobacillus spathodeae]MBM7656729.1 CDP-glycerol glycerophosphotransferase [Sporolactobacillus spathodeae]
MKEKLEKYLRKSIHARLLKFDATQDSWTFHLTFAAQIELSYIQRTELVFSYRYGEEAYRFPLTAIHRTEAGNWQAESSISLAEQKEILFAREYWDCYLRFPADKPFIDAFLTENVEIRKTLAEGLAPDQSLNDPEFATPSDLKIRLKREAMSEIQKLDLFAEYDAPQNLMMVPFYTKKDFFSIRVETIHVMARLDSAVISKHYMLKLDGFILFPVIDSLENKDCQKKLLLLDREENVISEWRAENVERKDLTEEAASIGRNYDWSGFSVEIDLKPLAAEYGAKLESAENYYFRLEFVHPKNGLLFSEEPVRVLSRKKIITGRHVIKINKVKRSLSVKRNRNNSVVLRMAPYTIVNAFKGKFVRLGRRIKKSQTFAHLYHQSFQIMAHLPVKKNLVLFESFFGRQYSCNPRAIYEYMRDNCPDYQLLWSASPKYTEIFEAHGVPYVKRFSLKWLYLMTRANYWVTNVRLPLWMAKPAHTIYLQTWHGTPLKRLAMDMEEVHMPGTNAEKYKSNFLAESARWDYLISPNAYSSEIFARAFGFHQEMLETGYPRNDFLYQANNDEAIKEIKRQYGLPLDKKVILYAPTWRDNQFYGRGRYKFKLDMDLDYMRHELGDQYVIIMRMHYLIANNLDLSDYQGFAYDFSHHEDIRELYLISDILITDYSSVFFDYANLRRPMIFFTYDIEDYRDNLRGFYFDFEKKAPGPLVKTTGEVIKAVKEIEQSGFAISDHFDAFAEKFCSLENGTSSKKVVSRVFINPPK